MFCVTTNRLKLKQPCLTWMAIYNFIFAFEGVRWLCYAVNLRGSLLAIFKFLIILVSVGGLCARNSLLNEIYFYLFLYRDLFSVSYKRFSLSFCSCLWSDFHFSQRH